MVFFDLMAIIRSMINENYQLFCFLRDLKTEEGVTQDYLYEQFNNHLLESNRILSRGTFDYCINELYGEGLIAFPDGVYVECVPKQVTRINLYQAIVANFGSLFNFTTKYPYFDTSTIIRILMGIRTPNNEVKKCTANLLGYSTDEDEVKRLWQTKGVVKHEQEELTNG